MVTCQFFGRGIWTLRHFLAFQDTTLIQEATSISEVSYFVWDRALSRVESSSFFFNPGDCILKEIMTRKMLQSVELCNSDETNSAVATFSTVSSVALQLQTLLVAFRSSVKWV
jgi:hypothetical protein